MKKSKFILPILLFSLVNNTYANKFVDSVNSQRFKGIANNNLGGSYGNLGREVIKGKVNDILYNSLKDDDLSIGTTTRVVEAFNVLDWYSHRINPKNQNRDMNEMEVKSEIRIKFPEDMAREQTQLQILDKQIENLEYSMKALQLQTAEWKNNLAQTASNDGAFYKDYMSDLAERKKELAKIQGDVQNSLASFDNLEKSVKQRFGAYSPNLAPSQLLKDQLAEENKVLKRMMKQFRKIELDIQADSANYEAKVFSQRVANANNHIKALQLLAETMAGVHRGLNSLTEIFKEMNMKDEIAKMYAMELARNQQIQEQKTKAELEYYVASNALARKEFTKKTLNDKDKKLAEELRKDKEMHNKLVTAVAEEKLRDLGYYDNVSNNIIGQKLIDSYGLSALQKDLLGGLANNLTKKQLEDYFNQKMASLGQVGKSILDQKIREALENNKLLRQATAVQNQVRELVKNPTGVADKFIDKGQNLAINEINNRLDKVTGEVSRKANDQYNKMIGSKIDQANQRIRQKVDEINDKLAKSGSPTRITEQDLKDLLVGNPNVNVDIQKIYKENWK